MSTGRIPLHTRLAYSIGHFQNDLMASMWFSYLLVYLHQVRNFNNIYAGTLLLVGQIADAIATPLIGYEADVTSGCCRYTKRKSWHAFGLICTTCSFPFIFAPVYGTSADTPDYALFIYYAAFVVIFQIGWASVQISHLSLIPELTSDKSEVAGLNGWRYAVTGVANLATYAIAWVIFSPKKGQVAADKLGAGDAENFRNLGFIVTGVGLIASIIFHMGVKEPNHDPQEYTPVENGYGAIDSIDRSFIERSRRRPICNWFKDIRFYQVALIYMCTRLFVNISQVYLPMYLTETVHMDKPTIANVPLVCYASSFLTATLLKMVDRQLGRELTYMSGLVFAIGASVFVWFIPTLHGIWTVYIAAVLIGIGGAMMLITSLSFVADLIGDFTGSSAFVYGSMSFTDKLANGTVVEVVQIFHPCLNCCPACEPYYRKVQTFVPGCSAVVALLGLCTLYFTAVRTRIKTPQLLYDPTVDNSTMANDHTPSGSSPNTFKEPSPNTPSGSVAPSSNILPGRPILNVNHIAADIHSEPSINVPAACDSDEERENAPLLRRTKPFQ